MGQHYSKYVYPLLLGCIAIMMYFPTLGHDFITTWDDDIYVVLNPHIRSLTFQNIKAVFTNYYNGNYAPLLMISYMTDYMLSGSNPLAFHASNCLIHAFNGILLFFFLTRVSISRQIAFVASLLFIVHPVQVESVAWVSERKNLLSMFFFLISLLTFDSYRRSSVDKGNVFYIISLALFLCSLLVKPVTVILPAVLLLLEYCFPVSGRRSDIYIRIIPYFVLALLFGALAMQSTAANTDTVYEVGRKGYMAGSAFNQFLTMIPVFISYLRMLVYPTRLNALYSPILKNTVDLDVVAGLIIILMILSGMVFFYQKRKDIFFFSALYLVALFPVLHIVPINVLMADRFLYFPLLGGVPAVCLLAAAAISKVTIRKAGPIFNVLIAVSVLFFSYTTFNQAKVWKNNISLWSASVKKNPSRAEAWINLGVSYEYAGMPDEALAAYLRAVELDRNNFKALNNLGILYAVKGDIYVSRSWLLKLVSLHPKFVSGNVNLARNYMQTNEDSEAEYFLRQAMTVNSKEPMVWLLLGNIYRTRHEMRDARHSFEQARSAGLSTGEYEFEIARLEAMEGNPDGALDHLELAVRAGTVSAEMVTVTDEFRALHQNPRYNSLLMSLMRK